MVQKQTRSVGVWSVVLATGRSGMPYYLSFHYIPLPPPSSGSSFILRSPSLITPSHHTLQPIQSLILRTRANPTNNQTTSVTNLKSRAAPNLQQSSEELPPSRSRNSTISGSVVATSSRIAAASARALPARAAHLPGWTHRLRPTALRASACTQQPHSTHLVR